MDNLTIHKDSKSGKPAGYPLPQSASKRNEYIKIAEDHVNKHKILPPIPYLQLSKLSHTLIEKNKLDKKYHEFLMVCCGNAIWKNVVKTIPFQKRVLLLPECLKNSTGCKAAKDPLGLICSHCNSCSITDIIKPAEDLGYAVLVTEGTTVTSELLKSGKVEAVIGVGCLESLEKMFTLVNQYSIPGVGIPLLDDGCIDTTCDLEWIKREINVYQPSSEIQLLNINEILDSTKTIFTHSNLSKIINSSKSAFENISIDSLLNGGQRWRPFLGILAYQAFSKTIDQDIQHILGVSLECFHKASLIHDDIQDDDDHRYNRKTIHKKYGIPIGINIGDYLLGVGYKLIADSKLNDHTKSKCLSVIALGHLDLSLGQGKELLNKKSAVLPTKEVIEIFNNKTAAAFRAALQLGAVMGGADQNSLDVFNKLSHYIGIAYQIKDDLEDFKGKDGDIYRGELSIIPSILFSCLNKKEKEQFKQDLLSADFSSFTNLINKYKIQGKTQSLLLEYITNAKQSILEFEHIGIRLAMDKIIGKIFNDYF